MIASDSPIFVPFCYRSPNDINFINQTLHMQKHLNLLHRRMYILLRLESWPVAISSYIRTGRPLPFFSSLLYDTIGNDAIDFQDPTGMRGYTTRPFISISPRPLVPLPNSTNSSNAYRFRLCITLRPTGDGPAGTRYFPSITEPDTRRFSF